MNDVCLIRPRRCSLTCWAWVRPGKAPAGPRFQMATGDAGALVDLTRWRQRAWFAGRRHRPPLAFRAPDCADHDWPWQHQLVEAGVRGHRDPGSPVLQVDLLPRAWRRAVRDRHRPPGFDIDEPLLELGRSLKLPPWLEPNRDQIARSLPPITLPDLSGEPA